jgi:uroporphyrinogen-III synthase
MAAMIDFDKTLVSQADLPLFGRRVLFCTPRNYAAKLSRLLVLRAARPVWMPTIVIEPMQDYSEFDRAIRNLADFRWLAFTSRNGIEAFFDRLEALGLDQGILQGTKLAALGNDGRALEARGLKVDCLPSPATTRGIVEELERRGENRGRVLLPVPAVYGMEEPSVIPDLVRWLGEAGMDVCRVPAYATTRVADGLDAEKRMILAGELDLIAFTSVAEIESLLYVLGDQRDVLDRHTLAFYGPMTAGGARQRGLKVDIVSEDFSAFEHYLEAMEKYFRKRPYFSAVPPPSRNQV